MNSVPKPPPPINRSRQPAKKHGRSSIDWLDIVSNKWIMGSLLAIAGVLIVLGMIRILPDRNVENAAEVIVPSQSAGIPAPTIQVEKAAEIIEEEKKPLEIVYSDQSIEGDFLLVIASMESIESANELKADLSQTEIVSEIVEDYSKGKRWFRVVGHRSINRPTVVNAAKRFDFETWIATASDQSKLVASVNGS